MADIIDASNNAALKNIDKKEYAQDKLDREELAKSFANIILKNNLQVFTINASWGNGKTFFIDNLLIKELEKNTICIKYNAWESDYFDNPLIPLISELTNELVKFKTNLEKEISSIKEITKNILLTPSLGFSLTDPHNGVKYGMEGKLQISKDNDCFSDYIKLKKSIKDFKNTLGTLENKIEQPLIIIVDELDRCRPDYAIKTLEVIKHFFDIKNIKFVIAVDKEQINNSIKALYGTNTETDGFLRKFVDLELYLPEPSTEAWIRHLLNNFEIEKKLSDFHKLNKCFGPDVFNLAKKAADLGESFEFKLRDYERIFTRINIIIDSLNPSKDAVLLEYLTFLVFAKFKNKEIFNSFLNLRNITPDDFKNILGQEGFHKFQKTYHAYYLQLFQVFIYYKNPATDDFGQTSYQNFYNHLNNSYKNKMLIDITEFLRINRNSGRNELKYVFEDYIRKVELAETILGEEKESL